jgi:ribosomal protein S18 acetylase RimI-like enzyme
MSVAVEHAIPERDAGPISRLIDICRSERRTVLDHYGPEEEAEYIMNLGPRAAVFVARVDGEFAGFAGIAPRWGYSERLRHCGEGGTWVMPEFRRRGVATALWREGILPFCRDAGFRHVGHFVMAHNERAIAFYENLGFRICGRHEKLVDWDSELLDAVEMEMWLDTDT